ncbi:MAG: molybdenum cofactor biosysynthesis protein [Verrucomicrobia bacterium]|nr:molybdenum cofactor biosysynthesis protein [Verrucomicrobiales bacterium]MDC0066589.1 molybdenum cofactor biosysynthesis protein [Verrucomicrobiota bacterium]OUU86716.1 MAG: molybdenum cofactor biosysynthesis protein [Verrucomicrobiaceae bacterium TMED76]RCL31855.1 MAG: molybdenum cofactor biosysynthesis protein [Verrucomicrobiota bacterium]|tara:strand:- start:668 stop:1144 length:477 start_codon:yes stop_codon:yes gene_type:complete
MLDEITIHNIYISDDHNFYGHHGKEPGSNPMIELDSVECEAGKGIIGDRFHNYKEDYKGQITFFSLEVYKDICTNFKLTDVSPSVFRRNVITSGVDLNSLINKKFNIQGIDFLGTQEAAPCYWMNGVVAEGAENAMKGRGGLRAKILTSGRLHTDRSA